jgi:transcriptional regulator with GAF, ATPase, and Fis domain
MNNAVSFPIPRRPDIAPPIGSAQVMQDVLSAVEDVSPANTTVLLLGESGTGKEVFARYIHALSPRSTGPWIAVNCAALPGELLESELFGHEKGSFTGASDRRLGRIEQADHGTLLLDEISEMPLALQVKLLRVLQERELDRVGGARPIPVDVRIIATSNRDLATMVAHGEFRADLYYRLSVFPILLAASARAPRRHPGPGRAFDGARSPCAWDARSDAVARGLANSFAYEFPGNVRELANVLERVLVRCHSTAVPAKHVSVALAAVGISSIRPCQATSAGRRPRRSASGVWNSAHDQPCRGPRDVATACRTAGRWHWPSWSAWPFSKRFAASRQPHPCRATARHQPAHLAQQAAGSPPHRRSHARWATSATHLGALCSAPRRWHGNRMKSQQHESL